LSERSEFGIFAPHNNATVAPGDLLVIFLFGTFFFCSHKRKSTFNQKRNINNTKENQGTKTKYSIKSEGIKTSISNKKMKSIINLVFLRKKRDTLE